MTGNPDYVATASMEHDLKFLPHIDKRVEQACIFCQDAEDQEQWALRRQAAEMTARVAQNQSDAYDAIRYQMDDWIRQQFSTPNVDIGDEVIEDINRHGDFDV